MYLIFLLNILFASTFTLGKAALAYVQPIFFVGVRMMCAGFLLLGYYAIKKRSVSSLAWKKGDSGAFVHIMLFQIYIAFVGEYWALQYMTSSKTALLYSIAPFLTALFSYCFLRERLSIKKIIGLCIGFAGFAYVTHIQDSSEQALFHLGYLSSAEMVLICSIAAAAYGWLVLKKLINKGYSFVFVNGWSMLGGGVLAFLTSLCTEHRPFFIQSNGFLMFCVYAAALIIIANVICYNLYGYLLHRYSATLLSFSGLTIPLCTAFFSWLWLGERISPAFIIGAGVICAGLYIFYQDELTS